MAKIVIGGAFLIFSVPFFGLPIYEQFQNPAMTQMQIFNAFGWAPVIGIVPLMLGGVLFAYGKEEYEDED